MFLDYEDKDRRVKAVESIGKKNMIFQNTVCMFIIPVYSINH